MPSGDRTLTVTIERFPIAGRFTIARGSRTEAVVVVAEIVEGGQRGRGECVPYARYGESADGVAAAIAALEPAVRGGLTRQALQSAMPAGAARNAVDCALWDLEAKLSGRPIAQILGIASPSPLITAYTLSLGTAEEMFAAAIGAQARPLLKVKLGGAGDMERIAAVREGAPAARLIVDANESWSPADFAANMEACLAADVSLIEQPFAAGQDQFLARVDHPVPICADESLHVAADIAALADRYDAVNVKLDKAGGLTEALSMIEIAKREQLLVMAGCMVGTSLAMAPALMIAQAADFVDLDGPLLLARDREPALRYDGSLVFPPDPALWG